MRYSSSELVSGNLNISEKLGSMLKTTASSDPDADPRNLSVMSMSDIFLLNKPLLPNQKSTLENINAVTAGIVGRFAKDMPDEFLNVVPDDVNRRIANSDTYKTGMPGGFGKPDGSWAGNQSPVDGDVGSIPGSSEQSRDLPLSQNFKLGEFYSRNARPGEGPQWNKVPPAEVIPALRWLCQRILEPMRAEFGAVTVTSAYRPPAHNRAVNGASNSRHMYDSHPTSPAVDLKFANGTKDQWHAMANRLLGDRGGLGIYNSGAIHIDNRPNKSRWDWR